TIELKFSRPLERNALVIVSVSWVDGWKGETLAGDPVELLPANTALIGAAVPEGAEGVVLAYAPKSFSQGAGLSLAGMLLFAPLLMSDRRAKGRSMAAAACGKRGFDGSE